VSALERFPEVDTSNRNRSCGKNSEGFGKCSSQPWAYWSGLPSPIAADRMLNRFRRRNETRDPTPADNTLHPDYLPVSLRFVKKACVATATVGSLIVSPPNTQTRTTDRAAATSITYSNH
jgi:hypothetical protein